jgi:hypothetical protein
MPAKCQQNASKMPAKCQQNASKMPAKCQQNASKKPANVHATVTDEKTFSSIFGFFIFLHL